jgi:5'-methylthioadenosine/S-adenosylhomocysteine nucleosidase
VPETNPTVVVLTALPVEYDAVRAHITERDELVHRDGTRVEVGRLEGTSWRVALAELGEGVVNAATIATQILTWLRPQAVLFVGVAGGLKDDLEIGDVVVGTKVYAVQGGKESTDGFLARPESWHGSHRLLQAARSALRDLEGVRGHRKPIACGDVVLANERSALRRRIQRTYNDAYAIEMEGSGASHAAHLSGQVDALVIRGISDLANAEKADADAGGSQQLAASQAAKVAVAVLRRQQPRGGSSDAEEGVPRGGDHIDFQGGTFYGPVVGKITGRP